MDAYQDQPIGTRVHLDVLADVPIWHPRTHDAKWKQSLRNLDDGEHVWMRVELSLPKRKAVYLVWVALSTSLMK